MNSHILNADPPGQDAPTNQADDDLPDSVTEVTPAPGPADGEQGTSKRDAVQALDDRVAKQGDANAPLEKDGDIVISAPDGAYRISRIHGAVFFKKKDDNGNIPAEGDGELVCSYVEIAGHLYAPHGRRGQWLMIDIYPRYDARKKRKGVRERCLVSLNPYGLVKEACSLVDRGLRFGGNVGASRPGSRLAQFIQAAAYAPTTPISTLVDHYGWLDATGRYFAFPGRVISGASAPRIEFAFPPGHEGYTKIKRHLPARVVGTADEWRREIWPFARYSTPMALAICVALSGCMVEIVGERVNPIIHFYGQSELGKSTIAHLATTVWGGRLESFNAATQGLQNIIASYDGFCAVMDEISDGNMSSFLKQIYPVASGEGREGATPDNRLREAMLFFLSMITTGEKSIADVSIKVKGRTTTLGEESRVLGFKLTATIRDGVNLGVFDHAPEGETKASLVGRLMGLCKKYRGAIGLEYVQKITDEISKEKDGLGALDKEFDGFRADFREKVIGNAGRHGVRDREIGAFARVALAGYKARTYGVLPPLDEKNDDPLDIVDLIADCCRDCIARETGIEARLDGCIADLLRVRPNQTDCYFSTDQKMRVNSSPYSRDLKCEAAVCRRHPGSRPTVSGEVQNAIIPIPEVLIYSEPQFKAVVDKWECNENQVVAELESRGVIYVTDGGRTSYRTRVGRFGLGDRPYRALSVGANAAESKAEKKAAIEEMNRVLRGEPFQKVEDA